LVSPWRILSLENQAQAAFDAVIVAGLGWLPVAPSDLLEQTKPPSGNVHDHREAAIEENISQYAGGYVGIFVEIGRY